MVNIPFNRYSKLYGAAGKLTTHGSQHFHKQNALKTVAFLSTAESPQLRVDTHINYLLTYDSYGITDFIGANALLGPVGGEGALDTPGPLNGIERSECNFDKKVTN